LKEGKKKTEPRGEKRKYSLGKGKKTRKTAHILNGHAKTLLDLDEKAKTKDKGNFCVEGDRLTGRIGQGRRNWAVPTKCWGSRKHQELSTIKGAIAKRGKQV